MRTKGRLDLSGTTRSTPRTQRTRTVLVRCTTLSNVVSERVGEHPFKPIRKVSHQNKIVDDTRSCQTVGRQRVRFEATVLNVNRT